MTKRSLRGILCFLFLVPFSINIFTQATTRYVSASGSNTAPYTSWATAAANIQSAVDIASANDLILVGDGAYTLSSPVLVTKGVKIRSLNGNSSSVIDGNNATQIFRIDHTDAVIDGFTLTRGYYPSFYGGGAIILSGGTIQNCIIINNQAWEGGGVAIENAGLVQNCRISGNRADNLNGVGLGGGVRIRNGGTVRNCLVFGNYSANFGGGIAIWESGFIQNCTITNNGARYFSGLFLRNLSVMQNSISYFNGTDNWYIGGSGATFSNNCTTPELPSGSGNIVSDPLFVNGSAGDYHLQSSSPCVNTGLNQSWMTSSTDLEGNSRIQTNIVDMGAYEYHLLPPTLSTVPVNSWPVSNATVYTLQPTLYWYILAAGTGLTYEVQCVKASDPWPADNVYASVTGLSFTFTANLEPGTQYAWRVRARQDDNHKSAWSAYALFTTIGVNGGTVAPIIAWPLSNATVYTLLPTLTWYVSGISTGLTYEVQCVKASDPWPADNVFASVAGFSFTFTSNLEPGTQYAWRVRSRLDDAHKSVWSEYALFSTVGVNGGPIKPLASWPVSNAIVYSLQPTLFWYLEGIGTGLTYEVQCVKASDPWPADNVFASVTGLTFSFTSNLEPGTQYAWRVRSRLDAAHKSAWSDYALFTTFDISGGPVIPTASWPILNATVYTLQPTLSWYINGTSTGLTYEAQCVKASAPWPADNVYASVSGLSFTFTSDLEPRTQYAWRVRSRLDATHKSNWSDYALFTTFGANGGPVVPTAFWPVGNSTVYTLQPTLFWYLSGVGNGLSYEAQCVKASDPWPADNVFASVTGLSFSFASNLEPGTQYAWRVRSRLDAAHKSDWSPYALFTTFANNFPVAPVAAAPTCGVIVGNSSAMLSWYLPTAAKLQRYDLQYSNNPDMLNPVEVTKVTDAKLQLNSLAPGTYYWRVKSITEDGLASAYSGTGVFQVVNSVLGIINSNAVPEAFKLEQNYPNPFNPSTIISFTIPEASFISLKIFDILGREIKTLFNSYKTAGSYSIQWDGKNNNGTVVQSGTYFYRLVSGNNNIAIKKLIFMK